MTVYARSDLSSVAVPRDSGGCGERHGRPTPQGAPVKLWALDCPQCETFLRHDDQWSVTVSGVPETPDEKADREEREKRGQQETTTATAEALTQIGRALPEMAAQGGVNQQVMLAMLTALTERGVLNTPAATVACANDHQMPVTAKFCSECGAPPHDAVKQIQDGKTSIDAARAQRGLEPFDLPETRSAGTPDFEAMSIRELQTYAAARSIKTTRGKADQIELIRAAQSG